MSSHTAHRPSNTNKNERVWTGTILNWKKNSRSSSSRAVIGSWEKVRCFVCCWRSWRGRGRWGRYKVAAEGWWCWSQGRDVGPSVCCPGASAPPRGRSPRCAARKCPEASALWRYVWAGSRPVRSPRASAAHGTTERLNSDWDTPPSSAARCPPFEQQSSEPLDLECPMPWQNLQGHSRVLFVWV